MKPSTWSNRVAKRLSDVKIPPLGPSPYLLDEAPPQSCGGETGLSRLFHNFFVVHGLANIDVRLVRHVGDSWVQVDNVTLFFVLVKLCINTLNQVDRACWQQTKPTCISVVFPDPAIPMRIQTRGFFFAGPVAADGAVPSLEDVGGAAGCCRGAVDAASEVVAEVTGCAGGGAPVACGSVAAGCMREFDLGAPNKSS